jgi:rhamnosyltransferase
MKKAAILLSTYNGEKYLMDLLDSIVNQDYPNYYIYIRDDGSTDKTMQIIAKSELASPKKVKTLYDSLGNIGFKKSFEQLLMYAQADYYFYCDQDDIWMTNKLSALINDLGKTENNIPALAFSDMELIDRNCNRLYNSYLRKVNFRPKTIANIFYNDGVPGCSIGFNLELKYLYFEMKSEVFLHDNYMFLLAKIFGKIYLVDKPLVKYRIHNANTIGLKKSYSFVWLLKDIIKYIINNKKFRSIFLKDYYHKLEQVKDEKIYEFLKDQEILDEPAVNKLNYFHRKKWFYKNLTNNQNGLVVNLVRLLLI